MKARPILFKPDMVNAILEGRKTMTRRIVKPLAGAGWRPETANGDTLRLGMITSPHPKKGKFGLFMRREIHPGSGKYEHDLVPCPYGAPGDVLWVRESFARGNNYGGGDPVVFYQSTNDGWIGCEAFPPSDVMSGRFGVSSGEPACTAPKNVKWKPSIHMPRWASRLTLEITGVRVERLQDITMDDVCAEGVGDMLEDSDTIAGRAFNQAEHYAIGGAGGMFEPEIMGFAEYWDSINGSGSWAANPWVWVVEFQPHHMNVDAFLRGREVA